MIKLLRKLRRDEEGATAIEYGLIAALIAVAAIGAMTALGTSLDSMFTFIGGELDAAQTTDDSGGTDAGATDTGSTDTGSTG